MSTLAEVLLWGRRIGAVGRALKEVADAISRRMGETPAVGAVRDGKPR